MRLNKLKNKKAILFTLDALFALLLSLSFFIYVSFYFFPSQDTTYANYDLLQIAGDSLAVLEKTKELSKLSTIGLQTYVDALPSQYCANITIYDSADVNQLSVKRNNCNSAEQNAISRRIFISGNMPYLAAIEVWYG